MRIALRRQVDKMMDAYVDWREACLLVSDAYRSWSNATSSDLAIAFRCYLEALDREERAAAIYERLVRRVGDLASADHDPAARLGVRGRVLDRFMSGLAVRCRLRQVA